MAHGQRSARTTAEIALLIAAFSIPLVYWSSLHYVYQTPKMLVFRLAVASILFAGFISLATGQTKKVRLRPPDLLVLLFVTLMAISAIAHRWPLVSLLGMPPRFEGTASLLGYAAIYWVTSRGGPQYLKALAWSVTVSAAIVGVFAILDLHGVFNPIGHGAFGQRAVSTMGNPLYVGAICAIALPISIGLLLLSRSWTERSCHALLVSGEVSGLVYSYSRGAWLAASIGVTLMILLLLWSLRGGLKKAIIPLLFCGVVGAVATLASLGLAPTASQEGATRVAQALANESSTMSSRVELWRMSFGLVLERPLLGWGQETFLSSYAANRPVQILKLEDPSSYADRPHNHLLYWAYAGGIPALVAYLLFLALIAWAGIRTLHSTSASPERKIAIACLMGSALAYEVFAFFSFSLPFYTFAGISAEGALVALSLRPSPRSRGYVSFGGRTPQVVGLLLLVLSLPFAVEAVGQTWADFSFASGARQPSLALSRFQTAVELQPRDPTYARALGQARERAADLDPSYNLLAERAYEQGMSRVPADPDLPLYLANLLRREGKVSDAIGVYEQMLQHDPYHQGALFNLASLILQTNTYPSEAVPLLERLITSAPNDGSAWYALGLARERTGDVQKARDAYRNALRLMPQDPEIEKALSRVQ